MGNYSEVAIAMTKKLYEERIKNKESLSDILKYATVSFFTKNEMDGVCLYWSCVKWYDNFEDIKEINTIISEEISKGENSIAFLRVGDESLTDVEEKYSESEDGFEIWDVITMRREIKVNI